jgi:hypothetical protein
MKEKRLPNYLHLESKQRGDNKDLTIGCSKRGHVELNRADTAIHNKKKRFIIPRSCARVAGSACAKHTQGINRIYNIRIDFALQPQYCMGVTQLLPEKKNGTPLKIWRG